jgi:hypothetical protein
MHCYEIFEALTFKTEHRGYHRGQSDLTLRAYDDGEEVGHIDYSIYQGEPAVQMISVPVKKRRGYATAMVHQLQSEFPDVEINMGGSTDDGSALLASIPQNVIHNREYRETEQRLEQVKARLAQYQAVADAFEANPTEQGRAEIHALTDKWNALYQDEWELERALRDMQPSKRLFKR